MQAIVQDAYGPPDVLELREIDRPVPKDNEVLVRVHAAGLDPGVWHLMTGLPYLVRLAFGPRRPKAPVRGTDVAGRVEAVGGKVTRVRPGDAVFGTCTGAFAEFACAREDRVAPKPANLSFEQAATVPVSACAALHALRDQGRVRPGQHVLVIGAAGGVGTFAVQLAKAFGAEVTAVCSTRHLDVVRSIGADHVVDYTTTDALGSGRRYDRILDTVGNRSVSDLRRGLASGGKAAVTGFTSVAKLLGVSLRGGKDVAQVQAHVTAADLDLLSELLEAGKVRPRIDRRYRFAELPAAIAYLEQGHARAKVVVEVA
ncbi:MAG: NAD(P)-dependent alcohol dehydrogenase [Thermoleophilia bacterium]